MTSPANQQNIPAPNTPTATANTSYASAASAPKKAAATPVIATGSNLVAGASGTASATHHAKPSSASPVNGTKPPIMPAVPAAAATAAAPAVVHGTSNVNGGPADHSRKDSLTLTGKGPNSYIPNGGPVGGPRPPIPQFGFNESPAVAHSTPQQSASAPIPIPGNARVPSPANSPSPIPQPSASGGRPPSTIPQDGANMKFGSLGGDGDRHMKHLSTMSQSSIPLGSQSPHMRRDSAQSLHNDMGNHGGQGPNRGGYQPQGGRARTYNNNGQFGNQSMGYPPGGQYPRGPAGPARPNMPPNFQQRGPIQQFPNSPQPGRGSPALSHAMPNAPGQHMQPPMAVPGGPGFAGYQYPPPGGYPPQNYPPYGAQFAPGQMGPYGPYNQMPQYMSTPSQSPSPGFPAPFAGGQFNPPPAQPMSRNPSQVSERPSSSTGQIQPPAIAQGSTQPSTSQPKAAPIVSSSNFQKPKTKAITIKNAHGETVNFSSLKAPSSPAPAIQPSKTPPAIVSTPTPPPKPATPSHTRTESATNLKTAEQLRNEFKEQVRKSTEPPTETKNQEVEPAAATAEDTVKIEEPSKVEEKPTTPAASSEPIKAKAEETDTKADAAEAVSESKDKPAEAPAADEEEDETERMIREMEEADARREAEQAVYEAKKQAAKEEAKKQAEAQRAANAANNDQKLRDEEREMERLEEERERQRKEREKQGGGSMSVAEALKKMDDLAVSDKQDSAPSTPTPDAVAAKLNDLKISSSAGGSSTGSPAEPASGKPGVEKQRTKPSALNLTPLNTGTVEPPQPSAALQSLKTARFIGSHEKIDYPMGINSPNPALNTAVPKKGNFKYDTQFLLQFKTVFTEKPSIDFDQQLKNLIGDGESGSRSAVRTPAGSGSGRQNSRSGAPGFPAMGSFGAKPLRTAAEQQFGMPGSNMGRPNMPPMASFGRPGGAFPGPSQMSRTPSSSNMGNMPNSPRQGSRSARGGSKRDNYNAKAEAQAAKTMPLTQGQEVKPITISATGWKPSVVGNRAGLNPTAAAAAQGGLLDPGAVQRKVKAALNKMTPEKFDKISDQILGIALQSKDEEDGRTLRQVIQLTFEKATDEAYWAQMYARFCKRMLEMMSPEIRDTTILDKNGNVVSGGALFRKYLLNRCQEEFERGWKVDLPKPKEGESKEATMLSDEYYEMAAAKRRGLGLVQFIGELYKLGMLTERIMHECVRKLVDYQATPDDAEIESLSKLLRTIGHNLDNTEKGKPMMDAYFARIQTIIDLPDLPSRLKFMLMDVVDLRKANWVSSEANKGPKTLEEVRQDAEAAAAQKAAETARSSQRGGGPAGGRPTIGRGDARLFSSYNQPAPNQVGMDDLRRLKGSAARSTSSNVTLGPTSMFTSRSNSGRRLGPGGALGRAGEDSGASSRTGTPPTRDTASHSNAFHILANMETENPASPPSTAASPALAKAVPDSSGTSSDKKGSD